MSVIERALEKARALHDSTLQGSATVVARSADPGSGSLRQVADVLAVAPAQRVVTTPQLTISEAMLSDLGVRAQPEQLHQQGAEYRHIKRQILSPMHLGSGGHSRILLVASALAGEGKTFTAVNLALSLALEPDFTVLLVDADVIKPNITRLFGLTGKPGLMDAAAIPAQDISEAIVTTSIAGLSLLPAGAAHANATEYFASQRMQQIFSQLLAVPNRIIVVDSLPMLLTTEVRALLPLAGQVLLVVRAESTPRNAVMEALDLMPDDTNVKLVLNAVERSLLSEYYGYGHGYGYTYAEKSSHG